MGAPMMGAPMPMGMPMMGAPMPMPMGMPGMRMPPMPTNPPPELPGDKLSPMECMQYGVPMGAVWGRVGGEQTMEAEDDVRGTQV